MAEVIVELIEGYFVEIDSLNHTLKKRYIGKNKKTGEDKEYEKIIGYYKNLPDCIERLVRLIPIDENDNTAITLREYAEASERAFKRVEELSKKLAVGNGGWIPCSEKLPEEDEKVYISTKTERVYVGVYTKRYGFEKREGFICDDGFMWMNTALAWKPYVLTEPYQPKGE